MNAEAGTSAAAEQVPTTTLTIQFAVGGNSEDFVREGWSHAEGKFRWMTGRESKLLLNRPVPAGDFILELDLHPFVRPPTLESQRLTVSVNGVVVGQSTILRKGRRGYRIPASALSKEADVSIVFTHPDAARPCDLRESRDTRFLSVSLERLRLSRIRHGISARQVVGTGGIGPAALRQVVNMDADQFILHFESLGDNCEFGVVQRRCGAEPFLSLLRFGGIKPHPLLRALDNGMRDFGQLENMEIYLDDKEKPEFVVREKRYDCIFHTFRYQGEIDEEKLRTSESERLVYCARKFAGDLERANKIFVIKRNVPLEEDEILPLYVALSSFGPNTLLWVVPADAARKPGTVEVVAPGLLKGFIGRFAPHENAYDSMLDDWLELCANAYRVSLLDKAEREETGVPARGVSG